MINKLDKYFKSLNDLIEGKKFDSINIHIDTDCEDIIDETFNESFRFSNSYGTRLVTDHHFVYQDENLNVTLECEYMMIYVTLYYGDDIVWSSSYDIFNGEPKYYDYD